MGYIEYTEEDEKLFEEMRKAYKEEHEVSLPEMSALQWEFADYFYDKPLSEMADLINDEWDAIALIARFRLKVNK